MAKETKVSETAQTSEEMETIEEISETAEATERTEVATETEAVEVPEEETVQPLAEEAPKEEVAEVTETLEAAQAEATEAVEEAKAVEAEATDAADAAEPAEAIEEVAELVEELPREADVYYYGTGRRKTSTAQVRLYPSKEPEIIVNAKQADQYFSSPSHIMHLRQPLQATATENRFRITVKVEGGGISGQAGAIRHGIARALTKANPELRLTLRKGGFLTRDPRVKERKKPGLKRARKAPQYTKR